jgi:beta-N-acetylhexosaminidase
MSPELDRLAAACLFPGFDGVTAPDWLLRRIADGLGGVVLFADNIESPEQLRSLTAELRRGGELLVATDEEGGDVTRLEARTGSSYPGNWALGVVDDVRLTEEVAGSIAADLAAVGINLDFAPVADVNSNPDNPVIGIRSFGAGAERVSRHVAAFVRGLQRRRIAACAKHFPGHGDTSQDSHLELPVVAEPSLEPFRAAIAAGVRTIMTAHVRVTSLGGEQATLSPRILTELLREELGFEGVAITDALEMRAVSKTVGIEEGAVRALAAGADALCLGAVVDDAFTGRVHDAIVAAVRTGRLPEGRLREAAGRIADLAAWAVPRADAAASGVGADAARRALLVDGDVALVRAPIVLDLRPPASIAAGEAEHGLAGVLGAPGGVRREGDADWPDLDGRQPVLVVRDAHRHEWERRAVEQAVATAPDAVVVELGLPLWRPEGAGGYIATHGGGRANLEAAASELSGSGSQSGR